MHDDDGIFWTIILVFAPISVVAFGGIASVLAPIHHQAVLEHSWMTQREFVDVFAISRAAPGPGATIVTLIGYKVAGWWGALVATLAMVIPSSLLIYGIARVWNRYRGTRLHTAFERGLAPIGTGLILAATLAIMRAADAAVMGWLLLAASTGVLMWRSVHPLLLLAAGGLASVGAATVFGAV